MRISIAADQRAGVAEAIAPSLAGRGHSVSGVRAALYADGVTASDHLNEI